MIVIMRAGATKVQVAAVVANVKAMGLSAHIIEGEERTVVAVVGNDRSAIDRDTLSAMDGVERMMPVLAPYKIASREVHPANTLIPLDGTMIGEQKIVLIAGARSTGNRGQFLELAHGLKAAGAAALYSGGLDNSPYASGDPSEAALALLAEVHKQTSLPIIIEVAQPELVPMITRYASVLEVAPHNMQNYALLNAVGDSQHVVLLRRGMVNTLEELLMAAEYVLARGNRQVILCEGGIRTYESYTHNVTLDINSIPVLKSKTHLPIIVDPNQSAAGQQFVRAASKAAIAAGADGLIIEVASSPTATLPEDNCPLNLDQFAQLVTDLRRVATAVDRII